MRQRPNEKQREAIAALIDTGALALIEEHRGPLAIGSAETAEAYALAAAEKAGFERAMATIRQLIQPERTPPESNRPFVKYLPPDR